MAEVIYTRKQADSEVNNVPIEDGQIIYTKQGHVFMDYGEERIPMQHTPDTIMSNTSNNAVQNKVIKNYVDNKVAEINSEIYKKVIWQNDDYQEDFEAQTIVLDETLNNYEGYEILFFQNARNTRILSTGIIPVGNGTILNIIAGYSYFRATSTVVNGNTITFENCQTLSGSSSTNANDYIIPYLIIGHKTTIFNGV